MKKIAKPFFIRLLLVAIPMGALYLFAQMAFEENRHKEHPTDVGLGIAMLLGVFSLVFFIAFLVDISVRIYKKQYAVAWTNLPFLLLCSTVLLYIGCNMSSSCKDCFCGWLTGLF